MITKQSAFDSINAFARHVSDVGYDRSKKHHLNSLFAVMHASFRAHNDHVHAEAVASLDEEWQNDRVNCEFVYDAAPNGVKLNGRFEPKPEAQFGIATIDDILNKLRKLAAFLPVSLPPTAPRPSSYQDLTHLNALADVRALGARVQND